MKIARILIVCLAALGATPVAAQVSGTLNWSTLGVATDAAIPSGTTQTSAGVTSTITWSTVTDGGSFAPYAGNDFVSYESTAQGGITGFAQLGFDNDRQDQDDKITLNIAFSEAVSNVAFTITDVDQNSWDDFIEVYYDVGSGYVNARTGSYVTSIGACAAIDDESFADGWEGTCSAASTSTDGNIAFNFGALNIVGIRIVYYSGNDAGNNNFNPGGQQLGVGNVTFNKLLPNLAVSKTVVVASLGSTGTYAIPGNDVQYTINAQNLGSGKVDNNSIVLIDKLPTQLTFYNGDVDGAGPATGAVYFTQASGTGLTFTLGTDLRYSNSASAPANFAACTYTPAAGYDANVRYICMNPKGTMQGGSPTKSFSMTFRAKIK